MRFIKNFDYFRKVSPEHTKPTLSGGLISLLSLTSIVMLFYFQVKDYRTEKIQKDTYIAQDPHAGQYLYMNINITFPQSPCYMIDMEVQSSIQFTNTDEIKKGLSFTRLSRDGRVMEPYDPNWGNLMDVVESLKQAVESGEQCNIAGKIQLYKVTGRLLISHSALKEAVIREFKDRYPELGDKFRISHVLESLTFGDLSEQEQIMKQFGSNEHTNFDMMQLVDDLIYVDGQQMKQYFYFVKLVPHIFIDEITMQDFRSYCYSLNHNSKTAGDVETITMIYDFSPVNMKITKAPSDFARFLVNLCAIIGGVFVIFGLLNRFIISLRDQITENKIR